MPPKSNSSSGRRSKFSGNGLGLGTTSVTLSNQLSKIENWEKGKPISQISMRDLKAQMENEKVSKGIADVPIGVRNAAIGEHNYVHVEMFVDSHPSLLTELNLQPNWLEWTNDQFFSFFTKATDVIRATATQPVNAAATAIHEMSLKQLDPKSGVSGYLGFGDTLHNALIDNGLQEYRLLPDNDPQHKIILDKLLDKFKKNSNPSTKEVTAELLLYMQAATAPRTIKGMMTLINTKFREIVEQVSRGDRLCGTTRPNAGGPAPSPLCPICGLTQHLDAHGNIEPCQKRSHPDANHGPGSFLNSTKGRIYASQDYTHLRNGWRILPNGKVGRIDSKPFHHNRNHDRFLENRDERHGNHHSRQSVSLHHIQVDNWTPNVLTPTPKASNIKCQPRLSWKKDLTKVYTYSVRTPISRLVTTTTRSDLLTAEAETEATMAIVENNATTTPDEIAAEVARTTETTVTIDDTTTTSVTGDEATAHSQMGPPPVEPITTTTGINHPVIVPVAQATAAKAPPRPPPTTTVLAVVADGTHTKGARAKLQTKLGAPSVLLDTGTNPNFISHAYAINFKLNLIPIPEVTVKTLHGASPSSFKVIIPNLTILHQTESVILRNIELLVLNNRTPTPIIIGLSTIRTYDLTNRLRAFFKNSEERQKRSQKSHELFQIRLTKVIRKFQGSGGNSSGPRSSAPPLASSTPKGNKSNGGEDMEHDPVPMPDPFHLSNILQGDKDSDPIWDALPAHTPWDHYFDRPM